MKGFAVTGAAGFIGSSLVLELLSQGYNVRAMDNFCGSQREILDVLYAHQNADKHLTFIEGDIRNFDDCENVCTGMDAVLHQAALGSVPRSIKEPELYNENNILGTFNMLKAASEAKVKRFVFASSSSVYGDTKVLPKVETMLPNPKSPYALSKLTGEHYLSVFWSVYGLPTIGLRYFNVFGPRQNPKSQYAAVIPKFVTAYFKNDAPIVHGDGEQTRDFTFIKNVVNANLNACKQMDDINFGKAYNIGCGDHVSVNTLLNEIRNQFDSTNDPIHEEKRLGDVRDSLADINEAKRIGLINDIVTLSEGLKVTVDWYKENLEK